MLGKMQSWAVASYCSELLQRANFPVAGASLIFEKNNGCGSKLSPFYRYRYSLLGVRSGQRKKFARALLSAHVDSTCSSHCFALILDNLFAVS